MREPIAGCGVQLLIGGIRRGICPGHVQM
jgi:hypothetical protein